jgi:riboflavin synthase
MFTGIVQGLGTIRKISKQPGLSTFEVELPATRAAGIDRGASISLSGVCLTVTTFEGQLVTFDLMHETLALTNLGERAAGDRVNIERSAPAHGEVGGHILSGRSIGQQTTVS